MYDFYIYEGKSKATEKDTEYEKLIKSSQVVAILALHLPNHENHKLFFDNWFSTLELMLFLSENYPIKQNVWMSSLYKQRFGETRPGSHGLSS